MSELYYYKNNIRLTYKEKARKYDTKHLIIVFSGFAGKQEFTYDFFNSLQSINSHVVWIKDDFEGHCSYYLCKNMVFTIEDTVADFIAFKLEELGLQKKECTLLGLSKGGTAALYFGVKYNYSNIISSVPQLEIATYLYDKFPRSSIKAPIVANHMLGESPKIEDIHYLNTLLPDLLDKDNNFEKNIYLLTSKSDHQYKTHIFPYLKKFTKYSNFNLIISKSILVRGHSQVTNHHIQQVLGLLYLLTVNIKPRFGKVIIYGDKRQVNNSPSYEPNLNISKLMIKGGYLKIAGNLHFDGMASAKRNHLRYQLHLKGDNSLFNFNLNPVKNLAYTRKFYNNYFVNYDYAGFRNNSIDLSHLEIGNYHLYISFTKNDFYREIPLKLPNDKTKMRIVSKKLNKIYIIHFLDECIYLTVKPNIKV